MHCVCVRVMSSKQKRVSFFVSAMIAIALFLIERKNTDSFATAKRVFTPRGVC